MQGTLTGNDKDPSGFVGVRGECNEDSPEPPAFSFQVHMPFSRNIFRTLWQQLSQLFARSSV